MSPEERQKLMAGVSAAEADPTVSIDVLNANQETVASAQPLGIVKNLVLTGKPGELSQVMAVLPPEHTENLKGRIYVRVMGHAPDTEYFIDLQPQPAPLTMLLPLGPQQVRQIPPTPNAANPALPQAIFQTRSELVRSPASRRDGADAGRDLPLPRRRRSPD